MKLTTVIFLTILVLNGCAPKEIVRNSEALRDEDPNIKMEIERFRDMVARDDFEAIKKSVLFPLAIIGRDDQLNDILISKKEFEECFIRFLSSPSGLFRQEGEFENFQSNEILTEKSAILLGECKLYINNNFARYGGVVYSKSKGKWLITLLYIDGFQDGS
jgi:hypothetical protein